MRILLLEGLKKGYFLPIHTLSLRSELSVGVFWSENKRNALSNEITKISNHVIHHSSETDLLPPYDGSVEEIQIPGMRKPKLVAEIAKQLRRFNEVEIPGSREPQLWKDISKFFLRASTLKFDDSEKQKKYEIVSFEEINKEVNDLKVLLLRDNKVLASWRSKMIIELVDNGNFGRFMCIFTIHFVINATCYTLFLDVVHCILKDIGYFVVCILDDGVQHNILEYIVF